MAFSISSFDNIRYPAAGVIIATSTLDEFNFSSITCFKIVNSTLSAAVNDRDWKRIK